MAAAPELHIQAGTLLAGKYRVIREVGRGGMAAVYEAEHIALGRLVAVKVLAAELVRSRVVTERFFREARAIASVKSPHIVEVYDSGRLDDARPFITMELLKGESLYDRMARIRLFEAADVVRIVKDCANGLIKAHQAGIVHRDLKPENIHLTIGEDGVEITKILDFGLAKFYTPARGDEEATRLTREGAVFGTPAYMSPEQVKGHGSVDHRADLWALACIAFELLTGRPVWNTEQGVAMTFAAIAAGTLPVPSRIRPGLPPAFDAWFCHALQRVPEDRFQDAILLADALATSLSGVTNEGLASAMALSSSHVRLAADTAPETTQKRQVDANELLAPSVATMPPRKRSRVPLVVLGIAGGVALTGVVVMPGKSSEPLVRPVVPSAVVLPQPSSSQSALPNAAPLEPWQRLVVEAQECVARGQTETALAKLHEAEAAGAGLGARSLVEHLTIAGSSAGPCRLGGIARPRTNTQGSSGRPTIAAGSKGPIAVYTDDHEQAGHEHAYAVHLDPSGAALSAARDVTPEADRAARPSLYVHEGKLVLLYLDQAGSEAGVKARWVDDEGRVAGPSVPVATGRTAQWPSLTRSPDGYWVAWQEERDKKGYDLFLRRFGLNLQPLSPELKVTDYWYDRAHSEGMEVVAPRVAYAQGALYVAFGVQRAKNKLVYGLRISLDSPDLVTGLVEKAPEAPVPGGVSAKHKDREIGDLTLLNEDKSDAALPVIECSKEGCFVVWHSSQGGSQIALLDVTRGLVVWRKRLTRSASHPSIDIGTDGRGSVAFIDGGRIRFAELTRDGIGAATTFGRAQADARPSVSRGLRPSEWYVTWLAPEGTRNEAFVARLICR